MAPATEERLPLGLRSAFDALRNLEQQLLSSITALQYTDIEVLAEAWEQQLRKLCERLAELDDPSLTRDALLALVEANAHVADTATSALDETMTLARLGAHHHKAITAYGAMDDDKV